MAFNSEVQDTVNGGWSNSFRLRVEVVRDELGLTLQKLGDTFGFSGPFVHALLNGKSNMASKHAGRVLKGLEALEHQAGIPSATIAPSAPVSSPCAKFDLEYHIAEIKKAGGTVTF
jgi:hypothetical protein